MDVIDKTNDLNAVKGIVHKNFAEKILNEKMQKQLDRQQKAFEKQHSRHENELKLVLQRLQLEQQVLDPAEEEVADEIDEVKSLPDESEDEGPTNPYPVMIMPKLFQSAKSDKSKQQGSKLKVPRRKSLEYEDVDRIKSSGIRPTMIAASFISKLRSHKKTNVVENETEETWCEHWETTASIRRPRKTIAEQNQHRMLARAQSEYLCNPSAAMPTTGNQSPRRSVSRKDDGLHTGDLHYEGTIEESCTSPRHAHTTKSRRGGSLKERKESKSELESSKMRRCQSTKERRRSGKGNGKDENEDSSISRKSSHEKLQQGDIKTSLSRKNSTEKSMHFPEIKKTLTPKNSNDKSSQKPKQSLSRKSSNEEENSQQDTLGAMSPKLQKEKHIRKGSLKERGEVKSKQGGKTFFSGLNKLIPGTKKTIMKQKSLSTESSPIGSTTVSPNTKDVHFTF